MNKTRVSARARVKVTLVMDAGSSWGSDCLVDQIFDQASSETESLIQNIFLKAGHRIAVENIKVTAVFAQEGEEN